MSNNPFFKQLEQETNVKPEDLFQVADSLTSESLQNEDTVRGLIKQISLLANVPVTKEKEDELVQAIVENKLPLDFASLSTFLK